MYVFEGSYGRGHWGSECEGISGAISILRNNCSEPFRLLLNKLGGAIWAEANLFQLILDSALVFQFG